jgi:hypothetical protein
MPLVSGNITRVAVTPVNGRINRRPVGNWATTDAAIADISISSSTPIYIFSALELTSLREHGLISDESLTYYKLRVFNTLATVVQNANNYDIGIPNPRILRALAALVAGNLLKNFAVDQLSVRWNILTKALTELEIRTKRAAGIFNDLTYCYEVLNLLRGAATTQLLIPETLLSQWSIDALMLTNCLVSNAVIKKPNTVAAVTTNFSQVSVKHFDPVLTGGVSAAELQSLRSRNIIGRSIYIYAIIRSLKAETLQHINPIFLEDKFAIIPGELFQIFWKLYSRGYCDRPTITSVTIQWLDPIPLLSAAQVRRQQRNFLKPAGYFMNALAAENSGRNQFQSITFSSLTATWDFRKKASDDHDKIMLNYLNRMIETDIIAITALSNFSINWIM